jgi:hypothetical protein
VSHCFLAVALELLIERVCNPIGLTHTRITLSADMKQHLAQAQSFFRTSSGTQSMMISG